MYALRCFKTTRSDAGLNDYGVEQTILTVTPAYGAPTYSLLEKNYFKFTESKSIENDLDGFCRLTDGNKIYEIRKQKSRLTLTTYTVTKNPFF